MNQEAALVLAEPANFIYPHCLPQEKRKFTYVNPIVINKYIFISNYGFIQGTSYKKRATINKIIYIFVVKALITIKFKV